MRAHQKREGLGWALCVFLVGCLLAFVFPEGGLCFVYVAAYIEVFCMNTFAVFAVIPMCALDDLEQRKSVVSTVNILLPLP